MGAGGGGMVGVEGDVKGGGRWKGRRAIVGDSGGMVGG